MPEDKKYVAVSGARTGCSQAAGLLLILSLTTACAYARPTTGPTNRPAEEHAERELSEQTGKLDAEYHAKKATLLRHHVSQLTAVKNAAIHAGNMDEAQRIYESISFANARISDLEGLSAVAIKPLIPFNLKISDFDGAGGHTNVVHVSSTDVSIVAENDFGRPPKVIWQQKLTADQQDRLSKFLRTFPLDRLEDSYVNMNVLDGYEVFFDIQIGDAPARKIAVGNRRQPSLERLIDEVNVVLPPRYLLSKMGN